MDDTFVVTKQDPQIMLSELNNIHPQVRFTFEPMVNNEMSFFNCSVIRHSLVPPFLKGGWSFPKLTERGGSKISVERG